MPGRKPIDIKQEQFEELCKILCTLDEIAGVFRCSPDTIRNWCIRTYTDANGKPQNFSTVYKKFSAEGKMSLRRAQFKLAETNASMAIFLGKQYLGQKDDRHDYNEELLKLKKREQKRKEEGW